MGERGVQVNDLVTEKCCGGCVIDLIMSCDDACRKSHDVNSSTWPSVITQSRQLTAGVTRRNNEIDLIRVTCQLLLSRRC